MEDKVGNSLKQIYMDIFELIPQGVAVIDEDNELLYSNDYMMSIL